MRRFLFGSLGSLAVLSLACRLAAPQSFPPPSQTPAVPSTPVPLVSLPTVPAAPDVPAAYQKAYDMLHTQIDEDLNLIGGSARHYPTTFAAELIVADDNRGPALLNPQTLPATAQYLDRLQSLGIKGVKSAIQFPLLTPSFPRYSEYLDFYKSVAQLIRQRGMTWTVQASILFANTPFSDVQYDFSGLTFGGFEAQDRLMVQTIIRQLKPDYLSIIAEPDTEATLTGLSELNDPSKGVELANYILKGLDRGSTRICAGTGSWTDPAYSRQLAGNTSIDCIAIHIYPVASRFIQNALTMASDAHANGKSVIVTEAWLYKVPAPSGGGSVAASPEAFKLDAFSFWYPLDEKFLELMGELADAAHADFLSLFWSPFLFSYITFAPGMQTIPYAQIRQSANAAASRALAAGEFSPTGLYLKTLIDQR